MELSQLTNRELNQLYYQIGLEILLRYWWLYAILVVLFTAVALLLERRR